MSKTPSANKGKHKNWLALLAGVLATFVVFAFQNCGKGYGAKDALSSTKQCQAKAKAEAAQSTLSATQLRCSDFNSYQCEQRVFSPDVEDMIHSLKECIAGTEICVDLEVRQFNTSGAKAGATPEQMQAGGDYNHDEIRCFHRHTVLGFVVFEGEGDSLEVALAKAMAACESGRAP